MEFYTIKEVAKMLRVDELTVYDYVNSKKLKAFRPGRKYLFKKEHIEEFLDNSLTA